MQKYVLEYLNDSHAKHNKNHQRIAFQIFVLPAFVVGLLVLAAGQIAMNAAQPAPELGANSPLETKILDEKSLPSAENTDAVVDAGNAFLAMISDKQKSVAQIELTPENSTIW